MKKFLAWLARPDVQFCWCASFSAAFAATAVVAPSALAAAIGWWMSGFMFAALLVNSFRFYWLRYDWSVIERHRQNTEQLCAQVRESMIAQIKEIAARHGVEADIEVRSGDEPPPGWARH